MPLKVIIIGSGVSSLSAASFLAKEGHDVTIIEKNKEIGGRARKFSAEGFTFDMGPSWYWMPDVFEDFYKKFNHTTSDFYNLKRLDPSYRVYWKDETHTDLPADMEALENWFEANEKGSAIKLRAFLKDAQIKYEIGMKDFVHKPSMSIFEFANKKVFKGLLNMNLFSSIGKLIRKNFTNEKIIGLLEFPVLFLGAMPNETPALYSLMNYADIKLGTWYPEGGMHKFIEAFELIALENKVKFITDEEVISFDKVDRKIKYVITSKASYPADVIISGADYQHTDKKLLNGHANYSDKYWDKRVMAPSCLLFYVGVNKKLKDIQHHNLFFDESLEQHCKEIYKDPKWPSAPLFYVCAPSVTDSTVAPSGSENLFFLIPIAPDLKDDKETREKYFTILLDRFKQKTGNDITENIVYKKSFCIEDFKSEYNAFKGNAYGLANTLRQTAILKPSLKNKNLDNFYYTGQLTVPGPGVPPSIVSGEVVAKYVLKHHS
ncbi:MAG: phytoene desaturase family protein [Crocinitomicaceae bacterium]|tara:strand:- start:9338 stop:10807 length:1470 start_codon:yes stop_codon:yes gene_type:complete